ncbi:hypothetical protein MKZ38_010470 [Zalerion maritima]|uniref:DM2 domain-containing protein n=1 Tax=Zalerion maritima TaxID=339359 RepID=A0AAD5RT40_9PEZI|nr:hypothetical protein MKZ38_010470 [Zalerion maritima]
MWIAAATTAVFHQDVVESVCGFANLQLGFTIALHIKQNVTSDPLQPRLFSTSLAFREQVVSAPAEPGEGKRKGNAAFMKPKKLSEPLADLVGETELPRPHVVKKIWEHIKANGLQDESDKRYIECDAAMQNIFNVERVHMFTMNKLLSQHLSSVDGGEEKSS